MVVTTTTHIPPFKLPAPELPVPVPAAPVLVPGAEVGDEEATEEVFDASNAAIFSIPAVIGTAT